MTQPRFEHLRKYHKILDPQVLSFAALPSKEFIGTFLLIFTVECNVVVSWHILLDKQLPLFRSFGFLCFASTRQSFRGRLPSFRRPLDWHGPLCGNPGPACETFGDGICTSRVHISFCASWHRSYCTSLREGDLSSSHPSLVHFFGGIRDILRFKNFPDSETPIQKLQGFKKLLDVPIQKLQCVPIQKLRVHPIQKLQVAPIQKLQRVPIQKLRVDPIQQLQVAPIQKLHSVPIQKLQVAPIQKLLCVPIQKLHSLPIQKLHSDPKLQVAPIQKLQVTPIQNLHRVLVTIANHHFVNFPPKALHAMLFLNAHPSLS